MVTDSFEENYNSKGERIRTALDQEERMGRTRSFISGTLWGGLVGAAIAILFAPASGEELREQMRARAERIQLEVNQAAAQRRAELERQLATLRAPRHPEEI
jgi:hypothetical protein